MNTKQTFSIVSLFAFLLLFASCSKSKSYAEMKRDEANAISKFIEEKQLTVVKELPSTVPFPDKVYYKTPEGLYLRIESKGTKVDFKAMPDDITVSYEAVTYMKQSTDEIINGGVRAWVFQYNNPYSYLSSTMVCTGVVIPLDEKYGLGDEAVVSLIIPSDIGTNEQQTYVEPVFYRELKYTVDPSKRPDQP